MENLYLNGYIKKDKIWEALHYAKINRRLLGLEDRELRAFVDGFNKVVATRHLQFMDKLDQHEMGEILELMRRNHEDIVTEKDLQTIGEILLDKEFRF